MPKPSKPRISLCMIAKDEEAVIARCLQSTRAAADEWIVVDTGSTDWTVEIARREGAVVHSRQWQGHFANSRNEAIALATGDWILVLDADEVLTEGQGELVRQLTADAGEVQGYFVQIVNETGTGSKPSGSSSSAALRLFRNRSDYRYAGRIHEQIVQPILNANPAAKLVYSDIQLVHGGYLPEVVRKKQKVQRNLDLLLKELENSDNVSFHRYNLGIEYMRLGDYTEALNQLRLCREAAEWWTTTFGHVVVLREAFCLQMLERNAEAIHLCEEAAVRLADFPDLFFTLGRLHYQERNWNAARKAFLQALALRVAPPQYTTVAGAGTYGASFHLGKTCEQMLDYEGAIACYTEALTDNPSLLAPFLRLIGLLARLYPATELTRQLQSRFASLTPRTWWSVALSCYQLSLYEQATEILMTKEMPAEKAEDCAILLMYCRFLLPQQEPEKQQEQQQVEGEPEAAASTTDDTLSTSSTPPTQTPGRTANAEHTLAIRQALYTALLANDDQAARDQANRFAALLSTESPPPSGRAASSAKEKNATMEKNATILEPAADAAAKQTIDPTGQLAHYELLHNLYTYLVRDQGEHALLLLHPLAAYEAVWSELHFLYMLAVHGHLLALQSQVQTYWQRLFTLLPEPAQRLQGRFQLIKTLHTRVFRNLQSEMADPEYAGVWNDVKPRLVTLVDDLLEGEGI